MTDEAEPLVNPLLLLTIEISLLTLDELNFRLLYVVSVNIMSVEALRLLAALRSTVSILDCWSAAIVVEFIVGGNSEISSVLSIKLKTAELLLPTITVSMISDEPVVDALDNFLDGEGVLSLENFLVTSGGISLT